MKQKIIIHDNIDNKTIEKEINVRELDHLDAQLKFRANVFKPKKGKGSFKRKPKHPDQF